MIPNNQFWFGSNKSNPYDPASKNFFLNLPTQPSAFMKGLYNTFFVNQAANLAISDLCYINGVEYEDNQRINLASPGNFTKTPVSTPLFDKYVGIKDDASGTTGYSLNYIPSSDATNVGLNDACWWIWFEPNRVINSGPMFGAANAGEAGSIRMSASDAIAPFTNIATVDPFKAQLNPSLTSIELQGLYSLVWNFPTMTLYHNGVSVATGNKLLCVDAVTFAIGELFQNFNGTKTSSFQGDVFAFGAGGSAINQVSLYNDLLAVHDTVPVWSFYGDSKTQGYLLPSPRTQCWPTLLCNGKGKAPFNNGVPNATIATFNATNMPLRSSTNSDYRLFLAWGVNDSVAYNVATYTTNLQAKVTEALAAGLTANQIVIITGMCTDPLGTGGFNTTAYLPYITAAKAVATTNSTQQFDLSTLGLTVANGGLMVDGVHETIAGHIAEANYLIANVL